MSSIPGNISTGEVLSPGEIVASSIDSGGDADWFRVTLTSGLSYGFTASGDGGPLTLPDPDIFLYDASGNQIVSGSNSLLTSRTITYDVVTGGTFYVGVSDGNGTDTGNYRLSWVATDTIENNNTTSAFLPREGTRASTIDVSGDADWYGVTLTAGVSYAFNVTGTGGPNSLPDGDLALRDALGNVVASSPSAVTSSNTMTFTPTASGTYYVVVSDGNGTDTGDYLLTNLGRDTIFNNATTGSVLRDGIELRSEIDVIRDVDWHRFEAEQGITYTFHLAGDGTNEGLVNVRLTLRDANGTVISTDVGNDGTLTFTATTDGPLYLDVGGRYTDDQGNYVLSVISTALVVNGTARDDVITGGATGNTITGFAGNDRIDGGDGKDKLIGANGADTLIGGNGNDTLWGGASNDSLSGGAGFDIINGGGGDDILRGGLAGDTFQFNRSSGRDVVLDFEDGIDRIQIGGGITGIGQLTLTQVDFDVVITFGTTRIELDNMSLSEISAADFIFG